MPECNNSAALPALPELPADELRAVLFDLDGTLADNFQAIHAACAHAMTMVGVPPADYATVRRTVGGSIVVTMERLVGRERGPVAVGHFRRYFDTHWQDGLVPLPGALALLRGLRDRGLKLAVLTNKEGGKARLICDHLGITPYVQTVMGEGDTPFRKPMPEFTSHLLSRLGEPLTAVWLVGDSPFDAETARLAGLRFLAVATGSHTLEELRATGAPDVFPDLFELGRVCFGLSLRFD